MKKFSYRILRSKKRFHSYRDIPKPRKGEMIVAVKFNELLDDLPPIGETFKKGRPSWWANLPSHEMSIRRCYGINDLLAIGWHIEAWSDFCIHVTSEKHEGKMIHTPFAGYRPDEFGFDQVGKCPISEHNRENLDFPKLVSPYYVRTPRRWSCLVIPSPFNYDPNYKVMPGVVHTDYFHDLHCALNVQAKEDFVIKRGTPLYYVIPFRRDFKLSKIVPAGQDFQRVLAANQYSSRRFNLFPQNRKGIYKIGQREADAEPRSLVDRLRFRD